MLRPSPVLTPQPANSSSPTAFYYAPAQSPVSASSRFSVAPVDSMATAARSSVRPTESGPPRAGGPGPSAPRPRLPMPSTRSHASASSTGTTSSGTMAAATATATATATSDSNHAPIATQDLDANYQAAARTADAVAASAYATSTTTTWARSHDSPLTRVSPSKRREKEIAMADRAESRVAHGNSTQPTKRARQNERPCKVLPLRYELCPVGDMVELISHMLNELIATNDAIRTASSGLTRFHSRAAPGISVRDYLHRLAKHATLTPPLLLSMVYYIDRLCAMYAEFTINTLTVHRFLITAATVAAKGLSDSFWNNTTYARVGGVRVAELKMLELEFLYRVDWRIVPNPEVLVAYYRGLVERTPGYEVVEEEEEDEDEEEEEEEEESDDMDHVADQDDG